MFIVLLLAIWLLAMGGWLLFSKTFRKADVDRFKNRLLGSAKPQKGEIQVRPLLHRELTSNVFFKVLSRFRLQERLQALLEQAGLKWTPAQLIQRCIMFALLGGGITWAFLPKELSRLSFVPAIFTGVAPVLWVVRKKSSRLRRFEELFPESLEFVARSMRAGHAFSVSLEMIHHEFQEPLSGEFRRAFEEHNLGLPLDLALQKLAVRVPSLDVHFFVSAVLLQKRTGGNLAEILDKLAAIIRERFKLRGRIRAISAHGRMTGLALTMIPVGVAVLMFIVNPDYVRFFFLDEVGNYMLAGAVALQLIGYGVIRKIVNIEI